MNLQQTAEEKFGKERAEELRSEIQELTAEIEKLRAATVDINDKP
jgi:hypothetical protein